MNIKSDLPEAIEEFEQNEATGVELEATDDDDFHDIERPWDPETIRVSTKSFSLRNMLDLMEENALDLAPDFQRLKVWKPVQKAQLIESILLQIPLPAFYFAEDQDGTLRVVDGVQRLSTIRDFVKSDLAHDGFRLNGLEYIPEVHGMTFKGLPPQWQRRIHNTQIVAHVIAPSTPPAVMYDIFRRINTGGTPLNAQEIRHCISKPRSRSFLKRLVELKAFDVATEGKLKDQKRMIDREVALRFVAFWYLGPDQYGSDPAETLDSYLLKATRALDDPKVISDNVLGGIVEAFDSGLSRAHAIFGEHAFRKWSVWQENRSLFNRALFEAWTVELARLKANPTGDAGTKIRAAARTAMTDDFDYIAAISSATGAIRNVHVRFTRTREMIESAS